MILIRLEINKKEDDDSESYSSISQDYAVSSKTTNRFYLSYVHTKPMHEAWLINKFLFTMMALCPFSKKGKAASEI